MNKIDPKPIRKLKTFVVPQHTVSIEVLYHYRCGACQKWWSIADDPCVGEDKFCPYCGTYAQAVEVKE